MEEILAKEEEHAEDLKTLIERLGADIKNESKPRTPDRAA
jgi:hypothetical protein